LKATFHLKDKVLFQAMRNDTKKEKEGVPMARPNRRSTMPEYLKDYM